MVADMRETATMGGGVSMAAEMLCSVHKADFFKIKVQFAIH